MHGGSQQLKKNLEAGRRAWNPEKERCRALMAATAWQAFRGKGQLISAANIAAERKERRSDVHMVAALRAAHGSAAPG